MSILGHVEDGIAWRVCHKAAIPVLSDFKDSTSWHGRPLHCGISIPYAPSGGQVADIEIGAFLIAAGNGPEKQELLRLIGTLV